MSTSFDPAAIAKGVNGFEPAEGHGQRGVHVGAVGGAGLATSTPLGMSTATTGMPASSTCGEHLGGGGPQGSRRGDPDHAVDHQIGCLRDAFDDAAAGAPERRQALRVNAFRVRARQQRPRRRADAGTLPPTSASPPLSPEPTTAHTRRPAMPPVRSSKFAGDGGGQPVGGTPHQGAVGQALQQRRLCRADRVGGVVVPHR